MPNLQTAIIGRVVEDDSDEPIAGATIGVWNLPDSTLATGAVSTEDGRFIIEGIRPGRYFARISFVGFESKVVSDIAVGPQSPRADLGTIRLSTDMQVMGEVEVTAERAFMEVGIDRTIYNVKDQLVSVGGNAVNVLENIPSVEVDIDGNISLRGNQNVAVLINGKPSPMTGDALTSFLQSLPADAVERVEVIPNPSAKYEPDGMAGILNLVLKQDRDPGISGGVTLSAETNSNYSASGNVNYSKDRIGLTTSYSFRTNSRDGEGWMYRENRFLDPTTFFDQDSFDERTMLGHNVNANLDYTLNKRNSLSLSGRLSARGNDSEGLTAYRQLNLEDLVTSSFDRRSLGDGYGVNTDVRLGFRRVIDPSRHQFSAELQYDSGWDDDEDEFIQEAFSGVGDGPGTIVERQINRKDEREQELGLQVDYTRPFLGEGKFEAGYKGQFERLDSDFFSETFDPAQNVFVPDLHLNNRFIYDQIINAAYGIVGTKVGRFGLQGGVRLEQAFTTFELETTNESY
ncbi:MAG: outer membrane beta-barrel protein, partial [Rhodothermales bacterium]